MEASEKRAHHAMMFSYIPDDVIFDVLSRLPVKSLLRFKSVCKHWRTIICSPTFVAAHLENSKKRPTILVIPLDIPVVDVAVPNIGLRLHSRRVAIGGVEFPLSFALPLPDHRLRAPLHLYDLTHCDGLLASAGGGQVHVHNLATREHVTFSGRGGPNSKLFRKVGLCFDSRLGAHKLIIPYHKRTILGSKYIAHLTKVEIIALTPDARRMTLRNPPRDNICLLDSQMASVDGAVYWMLDDATYHSTGNSALMCLDVSENKFEFIAAPRPHGNRCPWFGPSITEVHGKLCIAFNHDGSSLEMWMLIGHDCLKPTWSKFMRVTFECDRYIFPEPFSYGLHGPVLLWDPWHIYYCGEHGNSFEGILDMKQQARSDPAFNKDLWPLSLVGSWAIHLRPVSFSESLVRIKYPFVDGKHNRELRRLSGQARRDRKRPFYLDDYIL